MLGQLDKRAAPAEHFGAFRPVAERLERLIEALDLLVIFLSAETVLASSRQEKRSFWPSTPRSLRGSGMSRVFTVFQLVKLLVCRALVGHA